MRDDEGGWQDATLKLLGRFLIVAKGVRMGFIDFFIHLFIGKTGVKPVRFGFIFAFW